MSRRPWEGTLALAAVGVLAGEHVRALTYQFAVDVPATLSGTDRLPHQVVRSDGVTYALETSLDPAIAVGALHRRSDGSWLFAPAHAVTIGATTYQPADVVAFDGTTYSLLHQGSALGIPAYARIDALCQHTDGSVVMSFDVPVTLGSPPSEYSKGDLVRYAGSFSSFWDADGAGIPGYANVVGAAIDGAGTLVLSFDVPTRLGATEYMPGQLVAYNGSFASYHVDAAWPPSVQLRDFSFVPVAGTVPDGAFVPGTPLTVVKSGASSLKLDWGASCRTTDTDYEIYEGTIGAYFSHASKFCTTSGLLTRTFTAPAGSTYYLVVPRTFGQEGSYGKQSNGVERPVGAASCVPQELASCP